MYIPIFNFLPLIFLLIIICSISIKNIRDKKENQYKKNFSQDSLRDKVKMVDSIFFGVIIYCIITILFLYLNIYKREFTEGLADNIGQSISIILSITTIIITASVVLVGLKKGIILYLILIRF